MTQALEYLDSAQASTLLTKPLPLFYAVENLSKAVCLVRDPSTTSADFRAHGLKSDQQKRYSIKNLRCGVYATPSRDVWSVLFATSNADVIQVAYTAASGTSQVSDRREAYATKPLSGKTLLLDDVLRHLPELADDVAYARWGHPYCVHVSTWRCTLSDAPEPSASCQFYLRHGHNPETRTMIIDRESDLLKQYIRGLDVLDVVEYSGSATALTIPVRRLDVFGETYMDFRRTSTVLGELCLYFVAFFVLSSVVRYDPEQWKRLMDDHPAEAILIDRFLDLAVRKLPNLVLNELHGQVFLFKFSR